LYSNSKKNKFILGAIANIELGRFDQAFEDSSKCIKINQEFEKGYIRASLALFYQEKYEEAIEILNSMKNFDSEEIKNMTLKIKEKIEETENLKKSK
jgi:tetratricopeptide (TPR) repeat protein